MIKVFLFLHISLPFELNFKMSGIKLFTDRLIDLLLNVKLFLLFFFLHLNTTPLSHGTVKDKRFSFFTQIFCQIFPLKVILFPSCQYSL